MGAAALGAEVLKILEHLGSADLLLVLCFLGFAIWVTRRAFRNGQSVEVKVTLHSLEYRIGAKENGYLSDTLPQNRKELDIAVESLVEITEHLADDDKPDKGGGEA